MHQRLHKVERRVLLALRMVVLSQGRAQGRAQVMLSVQQQQQQQHLWVLQQQEASAPALGS